MGHPIVRVDRRVGQTDNRGALRGCACCTSPFGTNDESKVPKYELLGRPGLGVADLPGVDRPVGRTIGYHLRTGDHEIMPYDWGRWHQLKGALRWSRH